MSEKRLRVLFVLGSLGFGGTERQVLEILRHLDRQKFEPNLYLTYARGELLPRVPTDVPVHSYWERHQSPRLRLPGRILYSQIRDLSDTISNEKIGVVYDRASHMSLIAGLATPSHVPRVSVVVADPERDFANSHRRFRFIKRLLLRRAYQRADRVLAVSAGVRDGLLRYHGLSSEKVVICPNIFDVPRIRELAREACPDFTRDRFHIVCVGRIQREKGQQVLLQAVDQLQRRGRKELSIWMIGSGPDEASLRQYVADQGWPPIVRFEGYQPNPLPYMQRASVLCLPSLFEGMPNALVEAMACGTPVIASDCPSGPREILVNGRFGKLVPPGDAMSLANALDEAFQELFRPNQNTRSADGESNHWRAMAEAGRRHVEESYSIASGMTRLESVLLEVAQM